MAETTLSPNGWYPRPWEQNRAPSCLPCSWGSHMAAFRSVLLSSHGVYNGSTFGPSSILVAATRMHTQLDDGRDE